MSAKEAIETRIKEDQKKVTISFNHTSICVILNKTRIKTSRNLKIRCLEHLRVNKTGRIFDSQSSSSISEYINSSGHVGSLDDFKIISRNSNPLDLLIYESLLILKDRPTLNSQQSSIPLVLFE